MKITFTIVLTLLVISLGFSQGNSKDAQKYKQMKVIIGLQEYSKKPTDEEKERIDAANEALIFAMKNYWDFNEVAAEALPANEARSYVKANDGYCYVTIKKGTYTSMKHSNYRYYCYAETLEVSDWKSTFKVMLPKYAGPMEDFTAVYAVLQINKILQLMNDEVYTKLLGSLGYVKSNGPKIIEKTLLMPRNFIGSKTSDDDIKLTYPYDLEFADEEKVKKVVLERDPKYAVCFHVPTPTAGKIINQIYITNAEDGDIYGVLNGNNIRIETIFGSIGGNNGLIDKKELKELRKMVE